MHAVYIACLVGGAVATALFAILGFAGSAAHGHLGAGHAHAHAGGSHSAGSHGGHGGAQHGAAAHGTSAARLEASLGWMLSWLSPLTIAAAALWFGGIGLIAESNRLALLLAIVAAVAGAALIRGLFNALLRADTPPLQLSAEGALATVNATIRPDAAGEVLYTLEGLHRSLPARSSDRRTIPRGTAVVITRREGGFAWVEPLDPLADAPDERSQG